MHSLSAVLSGNIHPDDQGENFLLAHCAVCGALDSISIGCNHQSSESRFVILQLVPEEEATKDRLGGIHHRDHHDTKVDVEEDGEAISGRDTLGSEEDHGET